jgi:polyisoprenoid-binding protein YceI
MNRTGLLALVSAAGIAAIAVSFGTIIGNGGRAVAASPAAPAEGKTYTVDAVHSSIVFKIKHMNASNFYGVFKDSSGSFTLGDTASVNVTVKADSVDTRNSKRDDHVKSPDFLSVKEFAEITFTAKDLKKTGDSFKGSGELTLHGVKKSIEVEIKQTGGGPGMGGKGEIAGIESTFTVKRSDFGMKGMVGPLGDEVTLMVAFEGGAK